jgi:hypothetical protein
VPQQGVRGGCSWAEGRILDVAEDGSRRGTTEGWIAQVQMSVSGAERPRGAGFQDTPRRLTVAGS